MPRFGVEEEFLLVDPVTRAVAPRAAAVIDRARAELGDRVSGEITKFQIETKSLPCHNFSELFGQLTVAREGLAAAAVAEDLRIIASGTPVLGAFVPPPPALWVDPRPNRPIVLHSADVFVDKNALCYVTDFNAGLYIVEYKG